MEAAEHAEIQEPCHDLLDILRRIMMARIHQHLRARAGRPRQFQRHPPIGDVRVIESRFERLVFHQHSLIAAERCVRPPKAVFKPGFTMPNVLRARIIRPIRKPQRNVAAVDAGGYFNAIENMSKRGFANRWIGIP